MNLDEDFYRKWRAKAVSSRQLFLEDTNLSKIDPDKIFSSTALEEQSKSEAEFSLRLSESYVDDTQESSEAKTKQNQHETIMISDSSPDSSIFSNNKQSATKTKSARVKIQRGVQILESSEDDDCQRSPLRHLVGRKFEKSDSDSKSSKSKARAKPIVIEESYVENDPGDMQQILKETVAESITLSDRKKNEILNWLETNFDNMRCGSSCSQVSDSAVSDSRKSDMSSGNSSLERLEKNFETPNNRGKISRPGTVGSSTKKIERDHERQSRLDQFFQSSKGQLNIIRDKTPGSKHSDQTPTNVVKLNPRRIIDKTPGSKTSDQTPINTTRFNSKTIVQDKTPGSKCSDRTPVNIKSNQKRIIADKTPGSKCSDKTPISIIKANQKTTSIKTPGSKCSDKTPINNTKSSVKKSVSKPSSGTKVSNKTPIPDPKRVPASETPTSELIESSEESAFITVRKNQNRKVIPESESFESKESADIFEKLSLSDRNSDEFLNKRSDKKQPKKALEFFEITDDIDSSNRSSGIDLENRQKQLDNLLENKIKNNTNNKLVDKDNTDKLEKLNNNNLKNKFTDDKALNSRSELPGCLEITDDLDSLNHSSNDQNLENKIDNKADQPVVLNTTANTTINDCADILEDLYGKAWRNKAKTLISATEPKKPARSIFKGIQTEKKAAFKKPIFNLELDETLSDKENDFDTRAKGCQTTSKKPIRKNLKNSFINDGSTTESSPDCSYYTAVSNPLPSQSNLLQTKTGSTVKVNNKDKNTVIAICDSESDDICDDDNWKLRSPLQRKLSYDSSSSITSEFDPDDIVPPKPKIKSVKVKKFTNCEAAKTKTIQPCEKQNLTKSFLASLSKDVPLAQADFRAMTFRTKYSTLKEQLCKELYKLFNEKVFDNKLPENMSIEWSVRLRGTAGKCYNKQSIKTLGTTVRSSRIVLATKILDSPDRLRDTLIHEMCHAATWLVNNVSDGHGSFWKAWAHKAMKVFPELPPISRCHNYQIQTKYTYKCTSCGYSIGRHSKSLDLDRKRCGYCHGKFELLINKVTKDGSVQKKSTAQTRELTGFALYVKENYQQVKQSGVATKHGEVMKILGQQFSAIKLTPKPGNRCDNDETS